MAGTGQAAATGGHQQSLEAAHQALLSRRDLQFRFEELHREPAPQPNHSFDWLGKLFEFLAPALQWVFWLGVGALVLVMLFLILREIALRLPGARPRRPQAEPAPVVEFRPTAQRARALLEEADRLAREGRYSEAARVLLHRSIDDMERNFPINISPAMTSREIAQLDRLSAPARDTFSRIALAVELSLFGGRDLDAAQYQECRRIYESFAFGSGR